MSSAVDSTAIIDGESPSNALKRRRSSNVIQNEMETEPMLLKRIRSSSPSNIIPSDQNQHEMHPMFACLNEIVQNHRNLVREYVDLQIGARTESSTDEQRFIQAEEDLIEKAEKNFLDANQGASSCTTRNGRRQRIQSSTIHSPSLDRVKQEAHILKRIDELKSDGKWTPQRLGKCLEPDKRKTHWDYLLDEMRWLAEDFALERRWKKAMAKKISTAILKYFREKNRDENVEEKEILKQNRRTAQFICREVMQFWKNISKVAEYQETERRKELHQYQIDLQMHRSTNQSEIDSDSVDQSSTTSSKIADDEETIELAEREQNDEELMNELKGLQEDQLETIDTVLERRYGIDSTTDKLSKNRMYAAKLEQDIDDDLIDELFYDEETISNEMEQTDYDSSLTVDQRIERLIAIALSIRANGDKISSTSIKNPVSSLLKYSLRDYQIIAVNWLIQCYENRLNCILADESGLGELKTN